MSCFFGNRSSNDSFHNTVQTGTSFIPFISVTNFVCGVWRRKGSPARLKRHDLKDFTVHTNSILHLRFTQLKHYDLTVLILKKTVTKSFIQ